jgi:regulator of protease activity HflC (stomatin/prohibitin superfamily)
MIQERPKVREVILTGLRTRLKPYYLTVDDVNITNFDPSRDFMKSVERKQIMAQEAQTAENERLRAIKLAERDVATARGTAEANKILQESLRQGPEVLRFKELEVLMQKWDGRLPQFIAGGGAVPLLSLDAEKVKR